MTSQYFTGTTFGGSGSDATKALMEYEKSTSSKEKEAFIRNIAEDLASSLKLPGKIHDKPIDEVVSALQNALPNLKDGKKQLAANHGVHQYICDKLQESINNRMGPNTIPRGTSPEDVCRRSMEIMRSLIAGQNCELVQAAAGVNRIMANIQVLRNTLETAFGKMNDIMGSSKDTQAQIEAQPVEEVFEKVLAELDHQHTILANIVGSTINPTSKTIADLVEKDPEFAALAENFNVKLGTSEFSKKMTHTLKNMSDAAMAARLIDQTLKKVGTKLSEFKSAKDSVDLVEKLHEHFEKKHPNGAEAKETEAFMQALELIRNNDYIYSDIAKAASASGKGGAASVGENSLGKKLERQKKTREALFKDFESRLLVQYRQIFSGVEIIARRIGNQVPLDDHMQRFVNAMKELANGSGVDREKFYLVLTGYNEDAQSKEERQRFLGQLDMVKRAIEPLLSGPSGEHFRSVKLAVENVIETVDTFKDVYLKPITHVAFSGPSSTSGAGHNKGRAANVSQELEQQEGRHMEAAQEHLEEAAKELQQAEAAHKLENKLDHIKGMGPPAYGGADAAYVTLKDAIQHLEFFYKVAQVRHSLEASAKDIKAYTKDYSEMVGEAVFGLIRKIKQAADKDFKDLDWEAAEPTDNAKALKRWVEVDKDKRKLAVEDIKKFMKEQLNVKVEFLKTIEALDLYLAAFADGVASNPNDIKDLNTLLKNVDIVAKWFTDASGDNIADFYESFPTTIKPDGTEEYNKGKDSYHEDTESKHYYEWVVKKAKISDVNLGVLGGVENIGDDESKLDILLERAKISMDSVRVLDNLVSTFAKLGSQYGKTNLNTETKVPIPVMFKNIRGYIYHSALTMGHDSVSGGAGEFDGVYSSPEFIEAMRKRRAEVETDEASSSSAPLPPPIPSSRPDPSMIPPKFRKPDPSSAPLPPPIPPIPSASSASSAPPIPPIPPKPSGPSSGPSGPPKPPSKPVRDPKSLTGDDLDKWIRAKYAVCMSSVYDESNPKKPINGMRAEWYELDQFFVMAIKSMVAKVFTVIGTYNVFNKPLDKYKGINPTRLILGGGADFENPQIIPGAVELYIRLPLLAEFYRGVFKFQEQSSGQPYASASGDDRRITLVPEYDGVWENFIKLVFDEAKYVEEGTYSESQVKSLIKEINEIYKRYSHSGDKTIVLDVLSAFVAEINRRFGIVKQADIDKYLKEKRRYDAAARDYKSNEERLDYNILDERDHNSRGILPSDKYDYLLSTQLTPKDIDNPWDWKYNELVRNFRNKFDASLNKMMNHGRAPKVSFDQTIRQYKLQLSNSKDDSEKYKIILKAMQGVDQLNSVNHHKAIMFHEAVQAPLNTLYAIWTVVNQYARRVQVLDLAKLETAVQRVFATGSKDYKTIVALVENVQPGFGRYIHPGFVPHDDGKPPSNKKAYNPEGSANPVGDDKNILVYRGTYGATKDITWSDIESLDRNDAEAASRFVIDREQIFRDLVNLAFSFGADLGDLVQAKMSGNNLLVEYTSLVECVDAVLNSVKKNLELFRGVMDESVIRRAESNGQLSIYFIEERLVEQLLKDNRNLDESKQRYTLGLGKCNEIINLTFKRLAAQHKVVARISGNKFDKPYKAPESKATELEKALAQQEQEHLYDSYERAMANLVYWDPLSRIHDGDKFHGMADQPNVKNSNIDSWPYAVIPSFERNGSEDDDIKKLKSIEDLMKSVARDMVIKSGGKFKSGDWVYNQIDPTTGARVNAPFDVLNKAGDFDPSSINLGAMFNEDSTSDKDILPLGKRWNSLYRDRERIYQSAIRTPMDGRMRWYVDPSDPKYGTYFLSQIKNDEFDDDAGKAKSQFYSGLLVKFNEVLSKYLYNGWDNTTRKIYSGLISKFANGTHANMITKGEAINDIKVVLSDKDVLGVPQQHVVVFASLARAMRNILLNIKRSGDPEFRVDNMMELPIHMKETYRANLPGFSKLFRMILKKAEFLRHVAQQVSLRRELPYYYKYGNGTDATKVDSKDAVNILTGYVFRNVKVAAAGEHGYVQGQGDNKSYGNWNSSVRSTGEDRPFGYVSFAAYEDLNQQASKQWHVALLDDISSASASVLKCCDETWKELADEPKFLETHEGFIADYANLNKRQPIMLLSQVSIVLRNRFNVDVDEAKYARPNYMLPVYRSGEAPFKLNYGARLVLGRSDVKPTLEYMPGMNHLLDSYNGVSTADTKINKADWENFAVNHTLLLRYMNNLRFFGSALDYQSGGRIYRNYKPGDGATKGPEFGASLYDTPLKVVSGSVQIPGFSVLEIEPSKEVQSFQMQHSLDEDLIITESSDQDDSMKMIIESLFTKEMPIDSRQSARIYNILDMNIVPINMHALMREIPLVNLINYSYTCDQMIQNAVLGGEFKPNPVVEDKVIMEPDYQAQTPREFLAKTLIYPHLGKNLRGEYVSFLQRLITGNTGLDLGRPKFIGDQLYNKTLLRSVYDVAANPPDEAGPRFYNAQFMLPGRIPPTPSLRYAVKDKDGKTEIKDSGKAISLSITQQRFNTTFMRNLFFLVNLQRVMRMVMRDEVQYLESPVVNSSAVINREVTEYESNEQYNSSVFHN
jgi:hypothetical protein